MPSIKEHLDGLLQLSIRSLTEPCYACSGDGVLPDHTTRVVSNDRKAISFDVDKCPNCDGRGCLEPNETTPYIVAMVLNTVVVTIGRTRDADSYGAMNEAIDWGLEYVARVIRADLGDRTIEDATADFIQRVGRGDQLASQFHDPPGQAHGALTPEDIAALYDEMGAESE